jgi:hypothetical protein
VSLDPLLDPKDVLSTPVVISNDGMLALRGVKVKCFVLKIRIGPTQFTNSGSSGYIPPSGIIETGAKKTVPLASFIENDGFAISDLDILMIFSFKPTLFPFL